MLLRGLNYPGGLAVAADGHLWFTESLAHRVSRARISGRGAIAAPQIVIRNMPGYPSRLGRGADGGFWLSLFAVRTHLDRVRAAGGRFPRGDDADDSARDTGSRRRSRPAATASSRCRPAAIKALGIQKPWAPPRSYGLLARLDADGEVVESLHSRVGGRYHGITAAIETAQGLVIVSKGSGRVLLLNAERTA